jgi:hypothetical protein
MKLTLLALPVQIITITMFIGVVCGKQLSPSGAAEYEGTDTHTHTHTRTNTHTHAHAIVITTIITITITIITTARTHAGRILCTKCFAAGGYARKQAISGTATTSSKV